MDPLEQIGLKMDSPAGNMTSDTSSNIEESWIQWFCGLTGNHFFCEVDKGFIEDSFNLFGLKQYVQKDYNKALDIILDRLRTPEIENEELSRSASLLYGLIHARYIVTSHGLETMHHKYLLREFGECPRMLCKGQATVPMGVADEPKIGGNVRSYCPKCRDVYTCNSSFRNIDGAFFGPTFPSLFFMTYDDTVSEKSNETYIPRVFGFKIHGYRTNNIRVGSSVASSSSSSSSSVSQLVKKNQSHNSVSNEDVVDGQGQVQLSSDVNGTGSSLAKKIIELREVSAADMASAAMKRQLNNTVSSSVLIAEEKEKQGDTDASGKRQKII